MLRSLSLLVVLSLVFAADGVVRGADDKREPEPVTDAAFVTKVSESNLVEIQLGKLAATRGTETKVKEFGTRMAEDHGKTSKALAAIAKKHNLPAVKDLTEISKAKKDMYDKLSKLQGAEFDQEYIVGQVMAHEAAVKLFENAAKNGQIPELKAFAAKTLPIIQEHLKMAKEAEKAVNSA